MDSYYDMLNVQLSLVDEVEDWIASPEPPDSGQELHLTWCLPSTGGDRRLSVEIDHTTGVTPLRGPLVNRAERLRA